MRCRTLSHQRSHRRIGWAIRSAAAPARVPFSALAQNKGGAAIAFGVCWVDCSKRKLLSVTERETLKTTEKGPKSSRGEVRRTSLLLLSPPDMSPKAFLAAALWLVSCSVCVALSPQGPRILVVTEGAIVLDDYRLFWRSLEGEFSWLSTHAPQDADQVRRERLRCLVSLGAGAGSSPPATRRPLLRSPRPLCADFQG